MDWSANCRTIFVLLTSSSSFNLLKIDKGIRFILAPRSHMHLGNDISPSSQGIVKLLGSFSLVGIVAVIILLQSSVNNTFETPSKLCLRDNNSFMNFP